MDENVTFSVQMEDKASPVILNNKIPSESLGGRSVPREMGNEAAVMKQQPGFISGQLHREGTAGTCAFINYAILESTGQFR